MLCRIESCIEKLSDLTNVGRHDENLLRRRVRTVTTVEDENRKGRSGGDGAGQSYGGYN